MQVKDTKEVEMDNWVHHKITDIEHKKPLKAQPLCTREEQETEMTNDIPTVDPFQMSMDQIIDHFGKLMDELNDVDQENIDKIILFVREINFNKEVDLQIVKTMIFIITKVNKLMTKRSSIGMSRKQTA